MSQNQHRSFERARSLLGLRRDHPREWAGRTLNRMTQRAFHWIKRGLPRLRQRIYQLDRPRRWEEMEVEERMLLQVLLGIDLDDEERSILMYLKPYLISLKTLDPAHRPCENTPRTWQVQIPSERKDKYLRSA